MLGENKAVGPMVFEVANLTWVLGYGEHRSDDERSTRDTHWQTFLIRSFLIFQYGALDVGNDGMGVRDDGQGIYDTLMNIGNDYVRVDCKFGLRADGQ